MKKKMGPLKIVLKQLGTEELFLIKTHLYYFLEHQFFNSSSTKRVGGVKAPKSKNTQEIDS